MRLAALSLAALVLAGCAAAPAPTQQVASAAPVTTTTTTETKQVCTKERKTGSDIATTVCTTVMSDADRLRMQDELSNQFRNRMNQGAGQ